MKNPNKLPRVTIPRPKCEELPADAKPLFRWADVPKADRPYKNYVEEYLRAPDCPRTDELVERWAGIVGSVEIGIYVRAPGVEHEREQMQRELYPDRPEPGSPESIAQLKKRVDELEPPVEQRDEGLGNGVGQFKSSQRQERARRRG